MLSRIHSLPIFYLGVSCCAQPAPASHDLLTALTSSLPQQAHSSCSTRTLQLRWQPAPGHLSLSLSRLATFASRRTHRNARSTSSPQAVAPVREADAARRAAHIHCASHAVYCCASRRSEPPPPPSTEKPPPPPPPTIQQRRRLLPPPACGCAALACGATRTFPGRGGP